MQMKTIVLSGPRPLLQALSEAIGLYADAAYPPGGSECSQAARAGLLDVASGIDKQLAAGQLEVVISRRIKGHIKSAIQFQKQVYSEQGMEPDLILERANRMLAVVNGELLTGEAWR